jgi:predicted NAD/FAD-dependent oxidoreductase
MEFAEQGSAMMTDADSCIVIGAGISGLLAAQHLKRYGVEVTILEKSRGFGGRMACKSFEGAMFDIGAQFMTTREAAFRERVETWLSKEEVLPWYTGPMRNKRYVGRQGMKSVPDRIGQDLNVRLSERATKAVYADGGWTVESQPYGSEKVKTSSSDWLILTAPVPQSLDLLESSGVELNYDDEVELKKIKYCRCLSIMAVLAGPSGVPNPGAMDLNHDILRWIGDNHMKGISDIEGSVTIHSSPRFAEAAWDHPEEKWVPVMLAAAKPFLKADVVSHFVHRWRYSDPSRIYQEKHPFRKPFFIDEELHLGMAGDGFNGPRIESAAISGMELASAILNPF